MIDYCIPGGKQEGHHPNPGSEYSSLFRSAYLPANREGWAALKMLRTAFERGLIFTIGISRTTGSVGLTWNDIHHKTEQRGT